MDIAETIPNQCYECGFCLIVKAYQSIVAYGFMTCKAIYSTQTYFIGLQT